MKYIIVVCLWLVFMSNSLWANDYVIGYEIYGDANNSSLFEVKEQLFDWYDDISDRVDDIYIGDLLKSELHTLEIENANITFSNNTVKIIVEDGLGIYIKGELVKQTCVVKPRGTSFIEELLNK